MPAARRPTVDRDTKLTIIFGSLVLAVLIGLGCHNAARGDAILECMAEKGDVHNRTYYAECVEEVP